MTLTELPKSWERLIESVARLKYDEWRSEVMQYAPPEDSSIQLFEEGDWYDDLEEDFLAILNAALDSGVATHVEERGFGTLTINRRIIINLGEPT